MRSPEHVFNVFILSFFLSIHHNNALELTELFQPCKQKRDKKGKRWRGSHPSQRSKLLLIHLFARGNIIYSQKYHGYHRLTKYHGLKISLISPTLNWWNIADSEISPFWPTSEIYHANLTVLLAVVRFSFVYLPFKAKTKDCFFFSIIMWFCLQVGFVWKHVFYMKMGNIGGVPWDEGMKVSIGL